MELNYQKNVAKCMGIGATFGIILGCISFLFT